MVDSEKVVQVAKLASLNLSPERAVVLQKQFDKILEYFNQLQKVATDGVEPLRTPIETAAELRADEVFKNVSVEEIFANAPDSQGNLFRVPPVV